MPLRISVHSVWWIRTLQSAISLHAPVNGETNCGLKDQTKSCKHRHANTTPIPCAYLSPFSFSDERGKMQKMHAITSDFICIDLAQKSIVLVQLNLSSELFHFCGPVGWSRDAGLWAASAVTRMQFRLLYIVSFISRSHTVCIFLSITLSSTEFAQQKTTNKQNKRGTGLYFSILKMPRRPKKSIQYLWFGWLCKERG